MKNWMNIFLTLSLTIFIASCGDDSDDNNQGVNTFNNNFTNPNNPNNGSGITNFSSLRAAVQNNNFVAQRNTVERYMQIDDFNSLPEPCDDFICFDFDFNFNTFSYSDLSDFDVIVESDKNQNFVTVTDRRNGANQITQVNKDDIRNHILNTILDESKIKRHPFYGLHISVYPIASAPQNLYVGYMFVIEHNDGKVYMFSLDLPLAANHKLNQIPHSLIIQI